MNRILVSLLVAASVWTASACTGVYVGKKVSASGATLIGRTVDTPPSTLLFRTVVRPRVENVSGRVLEGFNGFKWPLPATTWRYVCTPATAIDQLGDFTSLGMNEHGFVVSAMVTGYANEAARKADPFVPTGLAEDHMAALFASTCRTAREAVALLGEVMAARGQREGTIVLFADPKEAWYVETYTGHEWAAVLMPEDKMAAFGNEFGLGSFDMKDPAVRCSPGLMAMPAKHGFLVTGADGKIDLARTYAAPRCDFAHVRTWFGQRAFVGADAAGPYDRQSRTDRFFSPSHKIAKTEIFAFMRNRGEGTGWCPETTGRQDSRIVGDESQCTEHVVELRDDLPAEIAVTGWVSLGASEHSVFLPINGCVTRTATAYADDSWPSEEPRLYDVGLASAHFRRLSALAELKREIYGRGIRDYWQKCENRLVEAESHVQREAARLYAESPSKAIDYLTRRAVMLQELALDDADEMFDDLVWYIATNNSVRRYGNNYHTGVLTPMRPVSAFSPKSRRLLQVE